VLPLDAAKVRLRDFSVLQRPIDGAEFMSVQNRKGAHLFEDERFIFINRVYSIIGDDLRSKPFTDGVGGEAIHFYFDVRSNSFVG